ncbi:MAG: tyrosine-type recombinase/integrase [Flavobacteriia bacterium]
MAPFFLLDDFVRYLQIEKRYSDHTVLAYQQDVAQFIEFGEFKKSEEIREVNAMLIRSWMVHLIEKTVGNRSVNRKLSSLRTFFKWLKKENVVDVNPMTRVNGPKNSKRLPSFAKESELKLERLDQLFTDDFDGVRDRLMFEVLYQTGVRLSELIGLKEVDVNVETIKVLGKRNKERLIPITRELFSLIMHYRKFKQAMQLDSYYLFVLNNGNKLYPKFVYRKINSYLGEVTSLDKCSPHVLRHTFATHMLNNGAGLEALKDILGHANLSATQVYTHNSFAKLTNIYSQAHPRGRKKI